MENTLQVFENQEFGTVRTLLVNNEPWFVGKDVAVILKYADPARAVYDHVDSEDKTSLLIQQSGSNYKAKTAVINESGLYSLVLSSKLPTAKKFKRWVTSEVLPTIRKHGGYLTPEKIEDVLLNPDTIIKLATELKEERAKRMAHEQQIEQDKPKVLFADSVSVSHTSILIGELAKLLQ
jgi:prophage antirepressor-like protein